MSRPVIHTKASAEAVHTAITREEGIVARNLRWIKAQATNQRICKDKALVQRVVRALKGSRDHNFKELAKEHNIPHHTMMYIWRTHL